MSLSAETMRKLVKLGLPKENLLEAIEAIEADALAAKPVRSAGAERTARYRARGGGKVPALVREQVMQRDAHTCQDCGSQEHLQIDHITPVSKGGDDDPDNLQVLCRVCNARKRDRVRKQDQRKRPRKSKEMSAEIQGKETPPTPPKENTPPSPPKGGHIPPVTPDDLEAIERAYHPAGLVNSNPQALLVPIGRAAVRLGGMPALLTAMRAYTKAVRDEDSKPVGLRKFLDPAEGFLDRHAKPKAGSDDGHWQARLAQFAKDGFWSRSWGAKPGSPGCKAPADLIRQTLKESA